MPLSPMLCHSGDIASFTADRWSFEEKHDGHRLIVRHHEGTVTLHSRSGRDCTTDYDVKIISDHNVVLDGEVVSLNEAGEPDFNMIQNKATTHVEYWAFDIVELDGRDLTRVPYRLRRQILESVVQLSEGFSVPPLLDASTGREAQALTEGREGVVAKSWDSLYEPGRRSRNWVKSKNWLEDDVVIGGWKYGEGSRAGTIGSILLGTPTEDGLKFCGRVGTGFTDAELDKLLDLFLSIQTDESPFASPVTGHDAKGAQFVTPTLTAAIQYAALTKDGRMRHPSWRGLRPE